MAQITTQLYSGLRGTTSFCNAIHGKDSKSNADPPINCEVLVRLLPESRDPLTSLLNKTHRPVYPQVRSLPSALVLFLLPSPPPSTRDLAPSFPQLRSFRLSDGRAATHAHCPQLRPTGAGTYDVAMVTSSRHQLPAHLLVGLVRPAVRFAKNARSRCDLGTSRPAGSH